MIRACQGGDESAFGRIYEAYGDRVYSLALRMSGDAQAAREIGQQVFLKVFTSIATFNFQARFTSWLFRLAMNVCLDHLRRQRRATLVPFEDAASPIAVAAGASSAEERLLQKEIADAVRGAVVKLSPRLRSDVTLKYVADLSYGEIAEVLGCSVGTVASRLNRGHKALEGELRHLKHLV